MNPVTLLIAEALIKYGPSLAMALVELFQKQEVTREDWIALFKLTEKSYEDYTK